MLHPRSYYAMKKEGGDYSIKLLRSVLSSLDIAITNIDTILNMGDHQETVTKQLSSAANDLENLKQELSYLESDLNDIEPLT